MPRQPALELRLVLTEPGKGKWLFYASMLWLFVGSELLRMLGLGPGPACSIAFASWLGLAFLIRRRWPDPIILEQGYLTTALNGVTLTVGGQETTFPLLPATSVKLTYQGFKGEQLAPRIWASGIDNFIQFNDGETYRFEVLTEQAQANLRNELRRWYLLKVKLKEHRRDGPTFLLHRDLSYEQIQAYKQEFGVGLYG